MNCRELEERLADDPQVEVSDEARLHLEECEACRMLLKDLRALRELSSELRDQAAAPAFFESRVCSRAGKQGRRLAYWTAIGTITAVTLLSVVMINLSEEGSQFPPSNGSAMDLIDPETTSARASVWGIPEGFAPLEGELSDDSQMTNRSIEVILPTDDAPGFYLELPARIEVRETQAENEFYLKSVSH